MSLSRLIVFVALALSLHAAASAAAVSTLLHLNPNARVHLLGTADAFVDTSGKAGISDVARISAWSPRVQIPTEGDWQQTPVWYRFTLERASNEDTFAIVWPGIIGRVDLYCDLGQGNFSHESGGYDAPTRSLTDHILVVPDDTYGRTCYLRALTGYHLSSPSIMALAQALSLQWSMAPTFGGFFVAIALFNLLMFIVLRQRQLIIYAVVILTALGVFVTDDSVWRYLHISPFGREFSHEAFGWLYFAMVTYFARIFLDLPRYDPKVDRTLLVLVGLSALELVAGFFPERPPWIDNATLVFLIALLVMLVVAGIRAFRRGYRGAKYFIVGSAGVCIGVTVNIVVETFALPVPEFVISMYGYGVAWEALWLTVALADRMNQVARENEDLRLSRAALEILAEVDPLTGVPNRRAFDEHLQAEWNRALRAGTSLGVIMIDVDHFKEYNDTFGHVAGDVCLTKIAKACAATLKRSGDVFTRYGGEEFAAILVTQNDEDLAIIAERMRAAVAELALPHPTNPDRIVTISLGIARTRPRPGDEPVSLVEAADEALYEAKAGGRNQVRTTLLATS